MNGWYPPATQTLGNNSGDFKPGYPKRGVIHTTEGTTTAGAVAAYKKNNSWPHFTVGINGLVDQHVSLHKAARALQNDPGNVETNRAGAIQIEVVGKAANTVWPMAQISAMQKLMRWIEAETGIKPQGPVFVGNEGFGENAAQRFTYTAWQNFNGWCGHQHVPENSHWDPGKINLKNLLPPEVPPMPEFPVVPTASPIQFFVLTPSGQGYYIVCKDGGLFAFGDAQYKGRVVYSGA